MQFEPSLTWPGVSSFVNQLTHDIRNDLNTLELEFSLLASTLSDPKTAQSVARLREHIRNSAAKLRELSVKLADLKPNRTPLLAKDLHLIWQEQGAALDCNVDWNWDEALGTIRINIDVASVAKALNELLLNAKQFGDGSKLEGRARVAEGKVIFELCERKATPVDPTEWGFSPFCSTKRGGYGLGLWESDRLVRANGGEIERRLEDGKLITRFKFVPE